VRRKKSEGGDVARSLWVDQEVSGLSLGFLNEEEAQKRLDKKRCGN